MYDWFVRRKEKQNIICNLFDFYAPSITPRETSIQETRFSLQGRRVAWWWQYIFFSSCEETDCGIGRSWNRKEWGRRVCRITLRAIRNTSDKLATTGFNPTCTWWSSFSRFLPGYRHRPAPSAGLDGLFVLDIAFHMEHNGVGVFY